LLLSPVRELEVKQPLAVVERGKIARGVSR
jgi:hypothetical protein